MLGDYYLDRNENMMGKKTLRVIRVMGWVFLIALTLFLILQTTMLTSNLSQNPPITSVYNIRYLNIPVLMGMHIIAGMIYIVLGVIQFIAWIRRKHIQFHKALGWTLAVCGIVSGIFGIISSALMPSVIMGSGQFSIYVFGTLFVVFIAMGVYRIKTGNIVEHRKWMIRAYAVGLAIVNARIYVIIMMTTSTYFHGIEPFSPALTFAWISNLMLAEFWIRLSSRREKAVNISVTNSKT